MFLVGRGREIGNPSGERNPRIGRKGIESGCDWN